MGLADWLESNRRLSECQHEWVVTDPSYPVYGCRKCGRFEWRHVDWPEPLTSDMEDSRAEEKAIRCMCKEEA
jgi:hypothetical protein